MFYNDMKKKPVAQLFWQRLMLPLRAVNGLLLQDTPAIVVNCFAHSFKFEVRHV
ncbi:virulence promoting factor [Enterobacter sp. R1(2018)]|nr:virulence promoting factor [Enterobacter sp. R1(2018)]